MSRMKGIISLSGQETDYFYATTGGTYGYQRAIKRYTTVPGVPSLRGPVQPVQPVQPVHVNTPLCLGHAVA